MPEMNLAVPSSPLPPPGPAPSAPGTEPAIQERGRISGNNDGQTESPEASFARVLKRQMGGNKGDSEGEAKTAIPAQPTTPEIELSAEAPAAEDLASLFPMLFGNAPLPAQSQKAEESLVPVVPPEQTAGLPQGGIPAMLPATATSRAAEALSAAPADPGPASAALSLKQAAIPAAAQPAEAAATTTETGSAAQEQPFETLLASREQTPQQIHGQGDAHRPAVATPAPAAARMGTPMGAPGWNTELGEKLVWMVNRQDSRAELVLNPPQLGRVEVSLTMNGDQANALFVSANPAVRDSLENALPRLREILLEAGITLGQAQVGAESANHPSGNGENGDNGKRGTGHAGDRMAADSAAPEPAQWVRRGSGLVDTFA